MRAVVWACVLLGCAAAPQAAAPSRSVPAPSAPMPAARPAGPAVLPVPPARPLEPPPLRIGFERVLEQPVHRIALDKPPHVAALGSTSLFVRTKTGFHEQALPASIRGAEVPALEIFYGRDYRVRVVGHIQRANALESVYLRALPGGLKPEPAELGQLGNSKTGRLVAVLGTDDPEIVCRPSSVCLIKRVTGWASLPAPAEVRLAAIHGGRAFILAGQQIFRADRNWEPVAPPGPWQHPSSLLAVEDRLYVIEALTGLIHVHAAGVWQHSRSPVGAPLSLWGNRVHSLWLVGSLGVAHFDGEAWRRVEAPPELVSVLGRNDEVWFAGKPGLYRIGPPLP